MDIYSILDFSSLRKIRIMEKKFEMEYNFFEMISLCEPKWKNNRKLKKKSEHFRNGDNCWPFP